MAKVTAEEYAEKMIRRTKGAVEDYRRGVQRVSQAPGIKAAARASKAAENYAARIADGTWAKKVGAVPLGEWQDKAMNKGAGRIASGLDAAEAKIREKSGRLLSAVDAAAAKAHAAPDATLDDRLNRAVIYGREMAKSKGKI